MPLETYPEDTFSTCVNCGKEIVSGPRHKCGIVDMKWFHIHNYNSRCDITTYYEDGSTFAPEHIGTPIEEVSTEMVEWW